jgi:predicted HicB family RNase H-like nuclease
MTIARIPKKFTTDIQTEDAFIEGKAQSSLPPPVAKRQNKTSIMLRIDPRLLEAIGREAKAAGLARSAWIHTTLTKAVNGKS